MKIIIIKKTSTVGLICKKNIGLNNLYKRAGFKKNNDFNKRHTWEVKDAFISIYARDTGRANTENKCELPPPIDTTLYFGSMVVIKHADKTPSDENLLDLSLSEWEKIYESLFGVSCSCHAPGRSRISSSALGLPRYRELPDLT